MYHLTCSWGWKKCPAVKNIGWFSRGPNFDFQFPHDGSQPSVTLVTEHLRAL